VALRFLSDRWSPLFVLLGTAGAAWLVVGPYLLRADWPLSGDVAGHLVTIAWFRDHGLHSWTFGWFAGMPLFYFYFPLPAAAGAALAELVGLGPAMRLLVLAGPVALPVCALLLARAAGADRPAAFAAGIGALAFLHVRALSRLGGTFEAAAIGEYSYSLALALALFYLAVIWPGRLSPGRVVGSAVLLAAVATSHLIVLLLVVVASAVLLFHRGAGHAVLVPAGWALAFLLSAFWTVPFLLHMPEMAEIWWQGSDPTTRVPLLAQAVPLLVMAVAGLSLGGPSARTMAPFAILMAVGVLPLIIPVPFFPFRGVPVIMLGLAVIAAVSFTGIVSAVRSRRAPARVVAWAAAVAAFVIVLGSGPSPRTVVAPYLAGDLAAIDGEEWLRMRSALRALPPGAVIGAVALNEQATPPGRFSLFTPPTMYQLPLLDGRRTVDGLHQESAPVSQYAREARRNLTGRRAGLARPFSGDELDFDLGVAQARALGARYIVLAGEAPLSAARGHPGLQARAGTDYWTIAEVTGAAVVTAFSSTPADPCPAEAACRAWFSGLADAGTGWNATAIAGIPEDALELGHGRIRFVTEHPGLPHLVRLSYFPGWRLETPGEAPRRFGPDQMLVVPASREVELVFSRAWPVAVGRALSAVGLLLGVVLLLRSGDFTGPRSHRPPFRGATRARILTEPDSSAQTHE
jgi:hypothetical protein